MSEGSNRFDRRTVLKGIGATGAAATGFGAVTGTAAAEAKRHLAAQYSDPDSLRAAFERHGDGLLATLREEGFVEDTFDLSGLDLRIDPETAGTAPTDVDGHAGVAAFEEEGTMTAFGSVSTSSDTHEIALFVQPERGEAYAKVEPKGGGDALLVDEDGVTPEGCSYISCGSLCSGGCWETRKTWNCDSNCRNCSVYDTGCGCCICTDPYCE